MVISFQPTATTDPLIEGEIFQSGYAYLLKGAGEVLKFSVIAEAGKYNVIVKARANTSPTKMTGRTYGIKVNGAPLQLKYIEGSAGPLLPEFGGASWGEYEATATLVKGLNTFEIQNYNSYGGVDYIELIPANQPKLYTEEQLKSPEMASFLSKMLGLFDKEDLEKAKQEATIAARVNYIPVSEVQTKIAEATKGLFTEAQLKQKVQEVTEALPLLVEQAVNSKTPIIQAEARKGWLPETEVEERVNAYKTVLKNEVIEVIEQS